MKCVVCCLPCRPSRRRSTYYRVRCWSRAPMRSHRSSPNSPTCPCRLESFLPAKRAQVLPLLKKAGLNSSSPGNYRPISNLSTVSKILERLVLTRSWSDQRTSACTSLHTGRDISQKLPCWRFSMESTRMPTTSRSLYWSVSTCLRRSIQSTTRSCSSGCSLSSALLTHR